MASHDVLSLSLDDIIKMKGRKRGSNIRGRGQKSAGHQDRGMSRSNRGLGRGRGWGRGRARGSRILSPKFTVQRAGIRSAGRGRPIRSRGIPGLGRGQAGQGRNRGGILNGRSRGVRGGRGGRGGSQEQRGRGAIAGRGRGRGSLRGRGSIAILRRGRGGITQRASTSQPQLVRQNSQQNITARDSSFRQWLARRKIQQARKTLVLSQQNNRAKTRLGMVNAMRGIQQEEQTKPVRGAGSMRGASSVVSLSSQHGLTVSIKNNIASNQTQYAGSSMRARPKLNRSRIRQHPTTSYTPAMFTVVNDQAIPPEPPVPAPPPPRKILKRNVTSTRDTRAGVASPVMVYPQQNSRPVPEPHRQILDPKVQKEIAMLQGKEVSLNSGPGPGVKGFRHIPSHTARSLNERFTEERMITT
ncbi:hypothetical protein O3P69_007041 [Scylla paramamosain]|uniref:UAP56-interacting factor n=1 Tax=Scylla paramamosain TaxID=85552 RepID=A0AAW0V5A5_SCYPA